MEKLKKKLKTTNIIITICIVLFFIGFSNTKLTPIIAISIIIIIPAIIVNVKIRKKINKINEILSTKNEVKINDNVSKENNNIYKLKTQTITDNEKYFLNIINKYFQTKYLIKDQVPLNSIIEKEKRYKNEYQNELNRIIDIGIFDKETTAPLLLIEINDNTHLKKSRRERDKKVKEICKQAGINIITFWTKYENNENYIINKIEQNLKKE